MTSLTNARKRRLSVRKPLNREPVTPPYPWAKDRRATIHRLTDLLEKGIKKISGQVCCKNCERVYTVEVDLQKVEEVGDFYLDNEATLHNRAPKEWLNPKMMDCNKCNKKECVRAVVDDKKKRINWLFLLITQSLGYCNLDQLKYFCKYTSIHRTGAKNRLLYLTYLGLLRQLDPEGPFPDPGTIDGR